VRGSAPQATLPEWVDENIKGLDEIVTMGRVLPKWIDNKETGEIVINMHWEVIDLSASPFDLLTSDRPVMCLQGLKSRDCIIMIPLDPHRLFVATHYDRRFRRHPPKKIAKAANVSTVSGANAYVYGTGDQHRSMVEKSLRKTTASLTAER